MARNEQDHNDHELRYRETSPVAEIAHLASCFIEFSVESMTTLPISHEVYPDGCITILYRRNPRLKLGALLIKGLSLEPFYTTVNAGDVYWGIKLHPAAAAGILRCDPRTITTQPIGEKVLHHLTENLAEKLQECRRFSEAQNVFTEMLLNLEIESSQVDQKVAEIIRLISETNGEATISKLAELVQLSKRQLERRFRKCSGVTPKQFSRIQRFRSTTIDMISNNQNWAIRAAKLGFADQAHLSREIFALTRHSPRTFEQEVRKIENHDLVS